MWEVEDYVRDTESRFANKVDTSVDKVSYQDSQTRKNISFNEAVMPCALWRLCGRLRTLSEAIESMFGDVTDCA